LYDRLGELIDRYRPGQAALEKLYFSTNVKTALQVAEARGVIRLCLEQRGVPCREFGPAEVKIAVCGHGGAAKPQMQKMVRVLLALPAIPKPDDAADALALALALSATKKFGQAAIL
jgi:crossover junction endodeoxyribonuclease RuvC